MSSSPAFSSPPPPRTALRNGAASAPNRIRRLSSPNGRVATEAFLASLRAGALTDSATSAKSLISAHKGNSIMLPSKETAEIEVIDVDALDGEKTVEVIDVDDLESTHSESRDLEELAKEFEQVLSLPVESHSPLADTRAPKAQTSQPMLPRNSPRKQASSLDLQAPTRGADFVESTLPDALKVGPGSPLVKASPARVESTRLGGELLTPRTKKRLPRVRRIVEEENEDINVRIRNEPAINLDSGVLILPKLKHAEQWLGCDMLNFGKHRQRISLRLMRIFDDEVLGGRLLREDNGNPIVTLSWSGRLTKTAGVTRMKRMVSGKRVAAVELSSKVLDEPQRLYNTLAHELCHAAAWIVDDVAKPPHGDVFKRWAGMFRNWDRSLVITTCHEYVIRYKFQYGCNACGFVYGRHSKSIDVTKKVCGRCRGKLELTKK